MNGRELKDYYKILGVDKNATDAEIKKAFHKLARKHHPDANKGDKEAEKRFKEISEAYEVLHNPEKRKQYDMGQQYFSGGGPGSGAESPFGDASDFGGFSDLFDLFGFGGGQGRRSESVRGNDLHYEVKFEFDDALTGKEMVINARVKDDCDTCSGTGAKPGTGPTTCKQCGGSGSIAQSQGFFSLSRTCPVCAGSGQVIENPCAKCGGSGIVGHDKKIKVNVPAGIEDGQTIKFRGHGEPGIKGGPPGDLYITAEVRPHPIFTRNGADILLTLPISFSEAALGAKPKLPTTNGWVNLKIPAGTKSGKVFRLKGKGAPKLHASSHGDMFVTVNITPPKKLDRRQKQLLKELAEFDDDPRKNIYTKAKK